MSSVLHGSLPGVLSRILPGGLPCIISVVLHGSPPDDDAVSGVLLYIYCQVY